MNGNRRYLRFSVLDRVEHWVLTLSFTILAVTGLAQKFSSGWSAQWIIEVLGGIESVRIVHRIAAIVMMLETVYHLGVVGYRLLVRRGRLTMLPGMQDVRVALHALMYNLGLREDRPRQGRYTFEEKAEYWALIWGTVLMTITGFMLWNPIATARILPGEFIPAAKAAHGGEALLAVLAIIVWHFYSVHIKVFNKSIFTGHLAEEEMEHEHPLELAEIKAGVTPRPVPPQALARRRQLYLGAYAIVAAMLLFGIYWFVSFEESAIETVPPAEQVAVFVPLTPTPLPTPIPTPTPLPTSTPTPTPEPGEPTPTAAPRAAITWQDDLAGLFQQKCIACHGEANALGGLNLSSYALALAGGDSGPSVQPGDPEGSLLVTLQEQGGHPSQFSQDELDLVRQWIEAGAVEVAPSEPEAGAPEVPPSEPEAGGLSWDEVVGLFEAKCGMCHSSAAKLGGLDVSSYQATLAGGDSGPSIQPGDPDGSGMVTLQAAGEHPGLFSEDELDLVRQWIADGALE